MAKKYRQVVAAIINQPWVIEYQKAIEITDFLTRRFNGEQLDLSAFALAEADGEEDRGPQVYDGVQVLQLLGTMSPRINILSRISGGTSTQILSQEMIRAASDDKVRTILLEVDSPGGSASGVAELAQIIRRVAEQKRVVVSARGQMASGAYWAGVAGTEVYAEPSATVGSVGVYTIISDVSQAAEREGVKYTVVRAGKLKASGNGYEPFDDEQRGVIQSRVDAVYGQFVSEVAGFRNVSVANVLQNYGEGSSFLASEAVDRGMIDGVSLFEDVFDRERELTRGTKRFLIQGGKAMKVTERVRAALFARGLTNSMEVSDEVCEAAITAICASRGEKCPEAEEEILSALSQMVSKPETPARTPQSDEVNKVAAERHRICELQAKGELLGISSDMVRDAINDGTSVEAAVLGWTDHIGKQDRPIGLIRPGDASTDKFVSGAVEALALRAGCANVNTEVANGYGRHLQNASMHDIACKSLELNGLRPSYDRDENALNFLKLGGSDVEIMTAGGAVDGPAKHPNLLSNLANKMLDSGYAQATTQYKVWCERLMDMPDFKPKSIIETGIFGELDITDDDEDVTQKKFYSQLSAWIQQDRYRNAVGMTVRMVTDDDLDGFSRQLQSLPGAADRTLNNICIKLAYANVTMVDGSVQFATANGNLIDTGSGGIPSNTEASDMRRLHRRQTNLGPEGVRVPINVPPTIVLVPATLEDAAIKTFGRTTDGYFPATEATQNTVRSMPWTIVVDAYLDEFSTAIWWTFIDPRLHGAFAYAYQRGYSAGGRRSTWFDNSRKTRYFDFEARFAACAKSRRGVVKNMGA